MQENAAVSHCRVTSFETALPPERRLASALLATFSTVVGPSPFPVVETVVTAAAPALVVLCCSVFALNPSALVARVSPRHQLPSNIRTTGELRSVIEELLRRSPTLRQQCARIATARQTYVTVMLSQAHLPFATRARSTARRYQSGLLIVDVEIPAASRDFAELLAHELEHVTEFIERVDFQQLANDRRSGVVRCGPAGGFESERAKNAGRTVAAEVE